MLAKIAEITEKKLEEDLPTVDAASHSGAAALRKAILYVLQSSNHCCTPPDLIVGPNRRDDELSPEQRDEAAQAEFSKLSKLAKRCASSARHVVYLHR